MRITIILYVTRYTVLRLIAIFLFAEFEDNLASKETKPDGSIFSAITDDTKNSLPSFGSSIKSHKTDDSIYSASPSTKNKHEIQRRVLILEAENHKYTFYYTI